VFGGLRKLRSSPYRRTEQQCGRADTEFRIARLTEDGEHAGATFGFARESQSHVLWRVVARKVTYTKNLSVKHEAM
jgi:hypothetical protein